MPLVCNFPFISIVLCMMSGIISSVLPSHWARRVTISLLSICSVLSACVIFYTLGTGESFIFTMGRFPAPWGNELRAGVLEGIMALTFSIVMLMSLIGGMRHVDTEVAENRISLYFIMCDLMLASLLALTYTNDLFTSYVFVEINTISACGLIMIRRIGRTFVSAARYMVMSQLGSGLFLIGLSMLYGLTGHLLMEPASDAIAALQQSGQYGEPLIITLALITVGLAIKSGLYPFHSWMPEAYGYSTAASSAILSGLVSKGYIILLLKIYYRVFGENFIMQGKLANILFAFGIVGIIMGSIHAIRESDIRRMIAFSSVAQIGYIYMGFGLCTRAGVIASLFHILAHAIGKSLLFTSATGLSDVSGGSKRFKDLRGAGYRNKLAGAGFTAGALSMVGLPLFAGFVSKLLFATAAVNDPHKMLPTLIVLAISTILNTVYFLHTVVTIYTPVAENGETRSIVHNPGFAIAMVCFVALLLILGMLSQPITDALTTGLAMFD